MNKPPKTINTAEFIDGELYINGEKWVGSQEETAEIMYRLRIQSESKYHIQECRRIYLRRQAEMNNIQINTNKQK